MAIKNLIARGVGFAPGSISYIPTLGFSIGAAVVITDPWKAQANVSSTWQEQPSVANTFQPQGGVGGAWKEVGGV